MSMPVHLHFFHQMLPLFESYETACSCNKKHRKAQFHQTSMSFFLGSCGVGLNTSTTISKLLMFLLLWKYSQFYSLPYFQLLAYSSPQTVHKSNNSTGEHLIQHQLDRCCVEIEGLVGLNSAGGSIASLAAVMFGLGAGQLVSHFHLFQFITSAPVTIHCAIVP
jgi:hypothetical protein